MSLEQREALASQERAEADGPWAEAGTLDVLDFEERLVAIEVRATSDTEIHFGPCESDDQNNSDDSQTGARATSVTSRSGIPCGSDVGVPLPTSGECAFDGAGEIDEFGLLGLAIDLSDYGINDPIATIDGELFTVSYLDSADTPLLATWTIGPVED